MLNNFLFLIFLKKKTCLENNRKERHLNGYSAEIWSDFLFHIPKFLCFECMTLKREIPMKRKCLTLQTLLSYSWIQPCWVTAERKVNKAVSFMCVCTCVYTLLANFNHAVVLCIVIMLYGESPDFIYFA